MLESITSRVDNVTHIPKEYMCTIVPPPKSVKIELTNICNLSCKFCSHKSSNRVLGMMDWNLYTKIVDDVRKNNIDEIGVFYLGESWLYQIDGQWKLPNAIDYAKNVMKTPKVFLTTNGVCLTKESVEQVIMSGLTSLKFSYNYVNSEQAKLISGKDIYETIVKNIKESFKIRNDIYEKTGYWCDISASSVEFESDQREKMKHSISEIIDFIDEHYWIPMCNQGGHKTELNTSIRGNIGRADSLVNPLPCWTLFTGAHIMYDGTVTICCFDHDGRFGIGNIKENTFMDIWNSKKVQELRKHHLESNVVGTICEGCML